MSFVLLIIGAVLLMSAIRGTNDQLFGLLKNDFTGPNNFIYWLLSIVVVGSLGYVPKLKPLSTAFLALIIIALIFSKKNAAFFSLFTSQLATTQQAQPSSSSAASQNTTGTLDFPFTQNTLKLPSLSDLTGSSSNGNTVANLQFPF